MATWTAYTYLGLCLTEPSVRLVKGPTIVHSAEIFKLF